VGSEPGKMVEEILLQRAFGESLLERERIICS
jgi:hypothetical protein